MDAYSDAAAAQDWQGMCDALTSEYQEEIETGLGYPSCAEALEADTDTESPDIAEYGEREILNESIDGTTATVEVDYPFETHTFTLEETPDGWRISGPPE